MRRALEDARLAPGAIGYLNLHGTGTPLNDAMEGIAVDRVFGGALPCSSTKPLVGHALGAAGAIEAALCWLMLERSRGGALELAPHCFDGETDPAIPALHLAKRGERTETAAAPRVMTNSFGFGGNNCTLVLGRDFPA
jgi:3-oxoacyl-[acyl-carrier-protein] synthase-1